MYTLITIIIILFASVVNAQATNTPSLFVNRIYAIGPGKQYPDILAYRNASGSPGFDRLQPGDIIEIYPNIINGVNVPYEASTANFNGNVGGMNISSNGTKDAPVIIRGMPDSEGRRPIIERDRI